MLPAVGNSERRAAWQKIAPPWGQHVPYDGTARVPLHSQWQAEHCKVPPPPGPGRVERSTTMLRARWVGQGCYAQPRAKPTRQAHYTHCRCTYTSVANAEECGGCTVYAKGSACGTAACTLQQWDRTCTKHRTARHMLAQPGALQQKLVVAGSWDVLHHHPYMAKQGDVRYYTHLATPRLVANVHTNQRYIEEFSCGPLLLFSLASCCRAAKPNGRPRSAGPCARTKTWAMHGHCTGHRAAQRTQGRPAYPVPHKPSTDQWGGRASSHPPYRRWYVESCQKQFSFETSWL